VGETAVPEGKSRLEKNPKDFPTRSVTENVASKNTAEFFLRPEIQRTSKKRREV
jgi:hypothetical protein